MEIIIERPAPKKEQPSSQLALIRLPVASCTVRTSEYGCEVGTEEGSSKKHKVLPVEAWRVSNSLDTILESKDPIFIENLEEGQRLLEGRYGSVVQASPYRSGWGNRSDTEAVFVCLQGLDSKKPWASLQKDVQSVGKAGLLQAQRNYSEKGFPGSLMEAMYRGDCYDRRDRKESIGDAIYAYVRWASCDFGTEVGSVAIPYVELTYDPKREQRKLSAKKGAEKRKIGALPGVKMLRELIDILRRLSPVEDINLRIDYIQKGLVPRGSQTYPLLMHLTEIQTVLGFPYRKTREGALAPARIDKILKSEVALSKHPILAPLVPWLKTEKEWLENNRQENEDDSATED
jgi:hypothetical protein